MKRTLIILAITFMALASMGQAFDGVPIKGDLATAIAKFRTKGYTLISQDKDGAIMKGMTNGREWELYISLTPITKQIWKMAVYGPKRQTWEALKADYDTYREILTDKYGARTDEYKQFRGNYYEGDGYEFTAVLLEKCVYTAIWMTTENLNISLEITKYAQIRLAYENNVLSELMSQERARLDRNAF